MDFRKFWNENGTTIEFYSGLALTVGGSIWGLVKAYKLSKKMEQHKNAIEETHALVPTDDISKKEITKHKIKVYAKAAGEVVKSNGLPLVAEAAGLVLMTKSHVDLNEAYVAAGAVAQGLAQTLSAYRGRAKKVLGDAEEEKLFNGIKEEVTLESSDGGESVESKTDVKVDTLNQFAFKYDNCMPTFETLRWEIDSSTGPDSPTAHFNFQFVENTMTNIDDEYQKNGYAYLNDLRIAFVGGKSNLASFFTKEEIRQGWQVGWDKAHPNAPEHIDLGLFAECKNPEMERIRQLFLHGHENEGIWIIPNCSGIVGKVV